MSLEFLKTISWSAGHGTNRTSKPIILKEFQHIVGLVKGEVFIDLLLKLFFKNNDNFRCNPEQQKMETRIRNVRHQGERQSQGRTF